MVADRTGVENLHACNAIPSCSVGMAVKTEGGTGKTHTVAKGIHVQFYIVIMAVGKENAHSVNLLYTAVGLKRAEVAVAPNLPKGNVGIMFFKAVGVPDAVTQMDDQSGTNLFHSPEHIVFVSVGIAHDEDFHFAPSSEEGNIMYR